MAEMKTQVTFAVKSSGSGGAGWIGKVEERDTPQGEPGRLGVYFGHAQEYTTHDVNMIDALRKSGVAEELYDEEVEVAEPGDPPMAKELLDEHGAIQDLEMMTVLNLKLMAKGLGIKLKSGQHKEEILDLIREAQA